MDELVALPIKGESFLLRRGRRHVLVDGGYNGRRLVEAITAHDPTLRKIDVVVCTHADRDHAGGLATLLENWSAPKLSGGESSRRVGQFWLPGSWADVLPDLMTSPREFLAGLIKQFDGLASKYPAIRDGDTDPEDLAPMLDRQAMAERHQDSHREPGSARSVDVRLDDSAALFDDPETDIGPTEPSDEPDWFARLRHNVGGVVLPKLEAARAFSSGKNRVRYRLRHHKVDKALAEFWLGLIDTAKIIRGIADQAIQYNVRIRWFDFDEFGKTRRPSGGVPNFLIPLNAVEQPPPPRTNISYLARLSPVNEACLAFLAPALVDRLGVVFCGDSPLGDGPNYGNSFLNATRRPCLPVVATAPHHGSENNKAAYTHLSGWNVRLWLRTGGTQRQPGQTFKALRFPERICTHCPKIGLNLTPAGVVSRCAWPYWDSLWITGHRCVCL